MADLSLSKKNKIFEVREANKHNVAQNMKFILGRKIEMSQIFDEQDKIVPITIVKAGPCYVTQVKDEKKDGYKAVQIGFEKLEDRKVKKPLKEKPYRVLREFRINEKPDIKIGHEINVTVFQEGDKVNIRGKTKGKGFAGAVKRWGFVDKAKAHGAKDMRRVGSTGSRFPQRTIKGRKMPGRMGSETKTIKNLKIIQIDPENNLLAIKGAIPGHRKTLLEIRAVND